MHKSARICPAPGVRISSARIPVGSDSAIGGKLPMRLGRGGRKRPSSRASLEKRTARDGTSAPPARSMLPVTTLSACTARNASEPNEPWFTPVEQ